ncbi:MAG: hypothetical protein VYC04_00115, partial [Actinomycetota bacterium]|nr:hypothetical protein [Actinomycetota bacterium]
MRTNVASATSSPLPQNSAGSADPDFGLPPRAWHPYVMGINVTNSNAITTITLNRQEALNAL